MNLLLIILFGLVQGLTEFLPVSSTGHLIILERLFNLSPSQFGLSFDVALHFGTVMALLVYFRKKILGIIIDLIQGKTKFVFLLIIGTLPALFAGVLLEKYINTTFRSTAVVAVSLIIFSFIFLLAERFGKKQKNYLDLNLKESLIIGIFQTIALLPGVSRSGITISGGLLTNLKERDAGEFAFLLSIPIVLAAFIKDIFDLLKQGVSFQYLQSSILGAIISFTIGLLCITYFLHYLKKHGLTPFIIYRILLALILLYFFKY